MNSFQIALNELDKNSVGEKGVAAIKVCEAADDMLQALEDARTALELSQDAPKLLAIVTAAIRKAKD